MKVLAVVLLLSGCMLDTRSQVKQEDEKTVMRKQVQTLQQSSADVNARFNDVEEDVKRANGRIEALETRFQRQEAAAKGRDDKASQALDARISDTDKGYREEFAKLHAEIDSLKAQAQSQAKAEAASDARAAKDPFAAAEDKFDNKDYKGAILDFEAYRKKNPKGKHFATATLKIGNSFQEMGMIDDARAFYEEVVSKFPKTKDATQAQAKLKSLKKK